MRRCTHCGMEIQPDVTICPYCFNAVEATKLCPHCGAQIRPEDRTCNFCEAPLPALRVPDDPRKVFIAMAKDPIEERERHPIRSNPFLLVYLLIFMVIVAVLLWQVYGHLGPGQPSLVVEGVLEEVAEDHAGVGVDLVGSEAAAASAWTALNKSGIPVRIRFGSLQGQVRDLSASDRAWVMAEVEPGRWVAGDPVEGSTMEAADHPLYYRGWDYASAADAQASLARLTRYKTLNAAIANGRGTTIEQNERSQLASTLARESGNLAVTV